MKIKAVIAFRWISIIACICLLNSCTKDKVYNEIIEEEYYNRQQYGGDLISFRGTNGFTRKSCNLFCKDYFGTIEKSNDTLFFNYDNNNKPNNEFGYMIKTETGLINTIIYKGIKKKYSELSPDKLNKIDSDDLYENYTASIEYKRIK